jgi:ubiquinol-cytochrome c reductase iron-sulfur subunit
MSEDEKRLSSGAQVGRVAGLLIALRAAWGAVRHREEVAAELASRPPEVDPRERVVPANRRAETLVAIMLLVAAALAVAFVVFYIVLQTDTQLLGLAMGAALLILAAAAIVAGKLVVPQETSVEQRDELLQESQVEELVEIVEAGGEGISRRRLLIGAGGAAGVAMVGAAAAPLASLGPPAGSLHDSPWKRGVGLVNDQGVAYAAGDIQIGAFYTALPEGQDWESFGAGLLVVRLPASMIHLPASRDSWTPDGIMAFSKICPHAGCAISLYRYPTYAPTSAEPAFTCPCHYSTFTPGDGGQVIFGPAGRALPQLPVMIDTDGNLRAAGRFDEDIGASWWSVRRT